MDFILSVLLAAVIPIIVTFICLRGRIRKGYDRLPPGPQWSFPVVGHLPFLGFHPEKVFLDWKQKYGSIIFVWCGSYPCVVLNDAKIITEAFHHPNLCGRPFVRVYKVGTQGKGITIADDNREQRQFIIRSLSQFGLKGAALEATIHEEISEVLNHFESSLGSPFLTCHAFDQAIINTMWNCIMSKRFPRGDKTLEDLANKIHRLAEVPTIMSRLGFAIPWIQKWFPNMSGYNEMIKAYKDLHEFMERQIKEHKVTRKPGEPRDVTDAYIDKVEGTTDEYSSFHPEKNVHPITTGDLFMGAMETTGTTLEWTLLYMALHPEVQEKLFSEINDVVGDSEFPALSHRARMPYTEAVVHEVLRMSSLAPLGVGHAAIRDTEFGGYIIPRGTMVISNIYGVQHDPEVWGDPRNFRPERFLDCNDNNKLKKSADFVVFSTGKRVCLGESLARDQLFLFTSRIFQRFAVHVENPDKLPPMQGIFGVTLRPEPFSVIFKRRF